MFAEYSGENCKKIIIIISLNQLSTSLSFDHFEVNKVLKKKDVTFIRFSFQNENGKARKQLFISFILFFGTH